MYPTNKILESRFNFNNDKFSEELINLGFKNEDLVGIKFNPLVGKWNSSDDVSVNYISTFLKI